MGARIVAQLVDQIRDPAMHLPDPVPEYRFHPVRKWRFDLAWPELKVALEVDGGVYIRGAHTRGSHVESDCEKVSEAAALGWRVLRVTPRHVRDGRALIWLAAALRGAEDEPGYCPCGGSCHHSPHPCSLSCFARGPAPTLGRQLEAFAPKVSGG